MIIHVEGKDLDRGDIDRLAAMNHDIRIVDCHLDESAVERLVDLGQERAATQFSISSQDLSDVTKRMLRSNSVRVD